jgi:4-amino-4-deoxychorismate lyase
MRREPKRADCLLRSRVVRADPVTSEMHDEPIGVWIDGLEGHAVSVLDRGLQYGDGLFETILLRDGKPRFVEQHFARLRLGCERLRIGFAAWSELAQELAAAASLAPRVAIAKIVVTRGDARARGYGPTGEEHARRTVSLWSTTLPTVESQESGVRVRIGLLRWGENPALAGLKHLNRLESVLARAEWQASEIFESLHLSASGSVTCGTMTNVFGWQGDRLITPDVNRCGVAGVMRSVVLRECGKLNLRADTATLSIEDLLRMDGLFLTNARIGILPINSVIDLAGRVHIVPVPEKTHALRQHVDGLDA